MGTDASLFKILVVEDDIGLSLLVRKQLEREGFEIEAVTNGHEAIDYAVQNHTFLMLLDYQLGDMTAVELLTQLHEKNISVPFVIFTGQGSEAVAVETMKLGARDYLVKNASFVDLLPRVVKQVVDELVLEQKLAQAQEALRKEKTHLLNHIPDMVFQVDADYCFTSCNPAVKKILGYDSDEIINRSVNEFLHLDDRTNFKKDFDAVRQGQQILRHPIRFLNKDGSIHWLEGNIVSVYNDKSDFVGISGIYQDITEQKIAVDELKKAEERIRLLVDTSPAIVLEFNTNNQLISVNKAGQKYFGFANLRDYLGRSYQDLSKPQWHQSIEQSLQHAHEERQCKITTELVSFRNTSRWFDVRFSAIKDSNDHIVSIMATAWDVSDRVEREAQMRQTLQNKEKNAQEASLLQAISLSAGNGIEMDASRVVCYAMEHVCRYVQCSAGLGYLFDKDGAIQRIYPETLSMTSEKLLHQFVTQDDALQIMRQLKTPKLISQIALSELSQTEKIKTLFDSSCVVPLVNVGKVYGFMIFIGLPGLDFREDLKFFSSLSSCAGLAIANAESINKAMEGLGRRAVQLERLTDTDILVSATTQKNGTLEAVINSSVNMIRARAGVLFLYNKHNSLLYAVSASELENEELSSLTLPLSNSISWKCISGKVAISCEDISKEADYIEPAITNLTEKSLLFVPLIHKEEAVGMLLLIDAGLDYDESMRGILESFADLAVQSLRSASLAERADVLNQKLAKIRKISHTITSSRDIHTVFKEVCQAVVETLGAKMAWFGLITKDSDDLKCIAGFGTCSDQLENTSISLENCDKLGLLASRVVRENTMQVVNNILTDSELSFLTRYAGFHSGCSLPIKSKGDLLGVLTVYHASIDAFSKENIALLEEFVDQAVIAILNVKLKRTLLESESLKEMILQSVNEALIVVDWTGSIVTSNMAAERLFEKDSAEFKHSYFTDLFGWENPISNMITVWLDSKKLEQNLEGWLELNEFRQIYVKIEGKTVMVEEVPCLLLSINDLTMQKHMTASLEHAEKLTTAGRIAGQIAHEIGNPLTLISSQIQRMIHEETIDSSRLKALMSHVDRISGLIRRFSDLERKSHLTIRQENIEAVIDNILALVSNTKSFEKITIQKRIKPALPKIEIDKNKITQVILNLLLNAADACSNKGYIRIEAEKRAVQVEIKQETVSTDYIVLTIADNGCGIDKERLKHIFEPFYTNKESGQGTGLGLSVSLSIVDQHQGWINVESEVNVGSAFSIYLPIQKAKKTRSGSMIQDIKYPSEDRYKQQNIDSKE